MIHYITTIGAANPTVGNELRAVIKAGVPVAVHGLRSSTTQYFSSEDIRLLDQSTQFIYPISIIGIMLSFLKAPFLYRMNFFTAFANALFSRRESILIRIKCLWNFVIACHWAGSLRSEDVDLIHSQWIHSCGTVGMYGAWLLDVPFSFTGHAADLFRDRSALRDKIKRAAFIICISSFHRDFFLIYGAGVSKLKIAYCGIHIERFPYVEPRTKHKEPFTILSSGRLVEKKGFDYLIDACKLLEDRFDFQCIIGGSGPLESSLKQRIVDLGLENNVHLTNAVLLQEDIPDFMSQGDCYCLPCVWSSDNDVDGLPQMLMEAMACGLPAISTRLVGIPDLIIDQQTGILIEPNNVQAIADAIENMYQHPELCSELSKNGRRMIVEKFNLQTCVEPLIQEFRKRLPQ